jgi:hypothetical protein
VHAWRCKRCTLRRITPSAAQALHCKRRTMRRTSPSATRVLRATWRSPPLVMRVLRLRPALRGPYTAARRTPHSVKGRTKLRRVCRLQQNGRTRPRTQITGASSSRHWAAPSVCSPRANTAPTRASFERRPNGALPTALDFASLSGSSSGPAAPPAALCHRDANHASGSDALPT